MDPTITGLLSQIPVVVLGVVVAYLFFTGKLRTPQEVESERRRGDENAKRAENAEAREDKLAESIRALAEQQDDLMKLMMERLPRGGGT